MKKVTKNLTFIFIMGMFFSACQKDVYELNKNDINNVADEQECVVEVNAENNILAFKDNTSFEKVVEKVDKMSNEERKTWEKKLGFKSLFTIFEEIDNAEIKFFDKIEKLNSKEVEDLMAKPDFKRHSDIVYKYVKKGVVSIEKDKDGIDYLKFINMPFPKLVNEKGLFLRNNNLIQYTKNKYKVLKKFNLNRINEIKGLNKNIDDDKYFVTDLILKTKKKVLGTPWSGVERVHTKDKKRLTFTETYVGHFTGWPYGMFYTIYKIEARSYRKYLWSWHAQKSTMNLWGSCTIKIGDTNTSKIVPYDSFYTSVRAKTVYRKLSAEGQPIPYVPSSFWYARRYGLGMHVRHHEIYSVD